MVFVNQETQLETEIDERSRDTIEIREQLRQLEGWRSFAENACDDEVLAIFYLKDGRVYIYTF